MVITGLSEPRAKTECKTIKRCWNNCMNRRKYKWMQEKRLILINLCPSGEIKQDFGVQTEPQNESQNEPQKFPKIIQQILLRL